VVSISSHHEREKWWESALVAGRASPDDPDLTDFWAGRRRKVKPALDSYNLNLLAKQDGRCPYAGITCSPRPAAAISARLGAMVAGRGQTSDRRRLSHPPSQAGCSR
jgi:hypothetical protein